MKIFFIGFFTLFLVSCSLVTTTPSGTDTGTRPVNNTGTQSGLSATERLISGVQYGSGAHTVTLFADFQCPACIRFADSIMPILESYASSGRLLINYKQYPLTGIHKNAYRDSLAALCANEQGKYMEYKKPLYTLEEEMAGATVTDEDRVNAAKDIAGMDSALFSQCLSSDKYTSKVDADIADGEALHVDATPTLFLDGKKLDFSAFQSMEQIEQFFASRL